MMRTNDNRDAAANAEFSAFDLTPIRPPYTAPDLAEKVDALIFDLWRLNGGAQGAWTLSRILARVAELIGGERLSLVDRDQILIALGEAAANFVPAMFDPEGVGQAVDDGLKALAALAVYWQQDHLARATRDPAEIAALLARARLCRLEMDGVVRRADRAQHAPRAVVACSPSAA